MPIKYNSKELNETISLFVDRLFNIISTDTHDLQEQPNLLDGIVSEVFNIALTVLAIKRDLLTEQQIQQYEIDLSNLVHEPNLDSNYQSTLRFIEKPTTALSRKVLRLNPLAKKNFEDILLQLGQLFTTIYISTEDPIRLIGETFEALSDRTPSNDSLEAHTTGSSTKRRDNGIFYTPTEIVKFLAKETLLPILEKTTSLQEMLEIRLLDPAVGSGFFLIESLRILSTHASGLIDGRNRSYCDIKKHFASHCLYGVDSDPIATQITRALMWIEVGDPHFPISSLNKTVKCGDSLIGSIKDAVMEEQRLNHTATKRIIPRKSLNKEERVFCRPLHWRKEFPEIFRMNVDERDLGFDVVLSNPPWGIIKPSLREYFSHFDREVSFHQGQDLNLFLNSRGPIHRVPSTKRMWERYSNKVKKYARVLRCSDEYSSQTTLVDNRRTGGDADLYKYFMERCFHLVRAGGRIGLVVPGSFQRSDGATGLRQLYLKYGIFDYFVEFINKRKLFPIHGMFRFLLLVFEKGKAYGISQASFGLTNIDELKHITRTKTQKNSISVSQIEKSSGESMSIPEVTSQARWDLFSKLHECFPRLGERQSHGWNIAFHRELDMTRDSMAFVTRNDLESKEGNFAAGVWISSNGEKYLPVVEGRMIHQFDSASKSYESGQARSALWKPLQYDNKHILPHYYVSEYDVRKHTRLTERAAFRDVTGHANERTILSAIMPKNVCCGNKVPTCEFDIDGLGIHAIWTAIANSFVLDWIARRRISTSMNYFLWHQLPFPRIDPQSKNGQVLISLALGISNLGSECLHAVSRLDNFAIMAQRAEARARIDALVANLFELTLSELTMILCDFPLLDRYQPRLASNGDPSSSKREKRSTITRDKVLFEYCRIHNVPAPDDIEEALGLNVDGVRSLSDRVALAEQLGAVAYVPSEIAKNYSNGVGIYMKMPSLAGTAA